MVQCRSVGLGLHNIDFSNFSAVLFSNLIVLIKILCFCFSQNLLNILSFGVDAVIELLTDRVRYRSREMDNMNRYLVFFNRIIPGLYQSRVIPYLLVG